jgi:hypothetical protein
MKNVEGLLSFILASLKDEDGGRVALYHYLKNFLLADAQVTPSIINAFFSEALQLPYWQTKKEPLQKDIQELLQRYSAASGEPFRLDQVWDVTRIQIVALEHPENMAQSVLEFEQNTKNDGDHLRVILESKSRVLSIRRLADGSMIVRGYNNFNRIVGNRLIPLGPDQEIHYDATLELALGVVQKLKASANSQVQFVATREGLNVKFIAGYAFRETQNLKVPSIHHEARLFYPLKRLEKFYVHRPSDPYYIEIVNTLENALKMLQNNAEGAQAFALEAFDIGQIAFDQVFSDDKGIYLRLKELAKFVNLSRRPESRPKEVSL